MTYEQWKDRVGKERQKGRKRERERGTEVKKRPPSFNFPSFEVSKGRLPSYHYCAGTVWTNLFGEWTAERANSAQ